MCIYRHAYTCLLMSAPRLMSTATHSSCPPSHASCSAVTPCWNSWEGESPSSLMRVLSVLLSPVQAATNSLFTPTASSLCREGHTPTTCIYTCTSCKCIHNVYTCKHPTHCLISSCVEQSKGESPLQLRTDLSAPWPSRYCTHSRLPAVAASCSAVD